MQKSIFHYVLAILEGVISGACFYHGQKEEQPMRRALLFVAGAGWFALSLLDLSRIHSRRCLRSYACGVSACASVECV